VSAEDDIRAQIERLLDRPINDEDRVVEIIVDAITSHYAEPELVKQAVRQAVNQYEVQLRIFMIANAKQQLRRITRLIKLSEKMEEMFEQPPVMAAMEPKDLVQLYAKIQGNIKEGLTYIKSVVDQRMEQQVAQAAMLTAMHGGEPVKSKSASKIRDLDSQQRDKVRRIVDGLVSGLVTMEDEEKSDVIDVEVAETSLVPSKGGNGDPRKP
jgi:hypothetical protein